MQCIYMHTMVLLLSLSQYFEGLLDKKNSCILNSCATRSAVDLSAIIQASLLTSLNGYCVYIFGFEGLVWTLDDEEKFAYHWNMYLIKFLVYFRYDSYLQSSQEMSYFIVTPSNMKIRE